MIFNGKAFAFLALLALAANAFAPETTYWLRGDDFTNFVEGSKGNFMTTSAPNVSSSKTVLAADAETGLVGRWYTVLLPVQAQVYSNVYLWANGAKGDGTFKWTLYDFNPESLESRPIAEGSFGAENMESAGPVKGNETISAGHRLKLEMSFEGENGSLTVDDAAFEANSEASTPSGQSAGAKGVRSTAVLFLSQCSGNEIKCSNDAACYDSDPFTEDTCVQAGTCQSYCEHAECEPKCVGAGECNDENPLTIDSCANAGSCNAFCENAECGVACPGNAQCDDNNPGTIDSCVYAGTCFSYCKNDEAGSRTIKIEGCRAIECTGKNCVESVALDCCGNSLCEQGENTQACGADCSGAKLEILRPVKNDYAVRGVKFSIVVKGLKGDSLKASGFFGSEQLFDDGLHDDLSADDGVFGNFIETGNAVEGMNTIAVENMGTRRESVFLNINVIPALEVSLKTDGREYALTDSVQIQGSVSRKGTPVKGAVLLSMFAGNKKIFSAETETDEFGNFHYTFRPSPDDSLGEREIRGEISDEYGNSGKASAAIEFLEPEQLLPLKINVSGLEKEYVFNGKMSLAAEVSGGGAPVEKARVFALLGSKTLEFTEKGGGVYTLETRVPAEAPKPGGRLQVSVNAEKNGLKGKILLDSSVKPARIKVKITEPEKSVFGFWEKVRVKAEFGLENGGKISGVEAFVGIGGEQMPMEEKGGAYYAEFRAKDWNGFIAEVKVSDAYGNSGSEKISGAVSGYSPDYYLEFYGTLVAGIAALVSAFIIGALVIYRGGRKTEELMRKERELTRKIRYVQTRYFKLGGFTRQKYDELMLKYGRELENVRAGMKKRRPRETDEKGNDSG